MAIPTYAQVIAQINTFIIANGNNEITANVLNPILRIITDFANNTIGDLATLTTDEKDTVVNALNSLKTNINNFSNGFIKLNTGFDDPNVTPPASYNYGDFYMELDPLDNTPIRLWQWNGFEWRDASEDPSTESDNVANNSSVPGGSVTDALNYLNGLINGLPEQLDFEANGVDNFIDIGTTDVVRSFFYGSVIQIKDDWTQTGSVVTFTFTPDAGAGIKNLSFI